MSTKLKLVIFLQQKKNLISEIRFCFVSVLFATIDMLFVREISELCLIFTRPSDALVKSGAVKGILKI